MKLHPAFRPHRLMLALAACGIVAATLLVANAAIAGRASSTAFDPLLSESGRVCGPIVGGQPALLKALLVARTETTPFQPAPMKAAGGDVPLYGNLGTLAFKVSTKNPKAQAYFNQGMRLSFGFNHAEAQRAFQAAQRLDPACAMCYWGEALVLGPNINVPMMPEANAPALAALAKALELESNATTKERVLIEALEKRYSADPKAERPALDGAFADAMKAAAERFRNDDTIQALYAEASMDTQPWDYWEAGGAKPKGRAADIVSALETVLQRNPRHPGAIHLYIHAMEASTRPEKALPHANRLAALVPGAGHLVHMPAHIYYRIGMYRESLAANRKAIEVDENYFKTSPSDPLYKSAYFRDSLGRVRNNGWALAGLVEVQRKKGDAKAEQAARQAYQRAWFGPQGGPDLARL